MDEKKAAPAGEGPGRATKCEHNYVACERIFGLAVCCTKCGHMITWNPDGTTTETYAPVHVK